MTRAELEAMTVADLAEKADNDGVIVTRGDGTEGKPRKEDFVNALAEDSATPDAGQPQAEQPKEVTTDMAALAKVVGRGLAAGVYESHAPVTWTQLSQALDMAANNSHGKNARREHDEEWDARRSRKGVTATDSVRTLEGNKDSRRDVSFDSQETPEPTQSETFIKRERKQDR